MAIGNFPTSKDIYLEVNGRKLAVAQSYKARASRESKYVEAFGSSEPVGTVGGRVQHLLELSRVCLADRGLTDGVDFYALDNFNVVIVKPDRRIIYSGCQWAEIAEGAALGDVMVETVKIVASGRMELRN